MNKKNIVLVSGVILVAVVLLVVLFISISTRNQSSLNNSQQLPEGATNEISLKQVAEHGSKDSCWTIINQSVYDITNYISSHPGGEVILQACGTIGTDLFNDRVDNSGQKKGPHPNKAKNDLDKYKIGIISP